MKDSDWHILCQLYRNPNMTKVSNILFMSQPTLTKRIQHMEEEFGVTIVNRTGKGLVFTPEGEYLGQRAEEYLRFREETVRELEKMKESTTYTIRLASSYTYSRYSLSDLIVHYRKEHPCVEISVVNESSDILFRWLVEGTVDAAFVQGDYSGPVNRIFAGRRPAYVITKNPVNLKDLPSMQRLTYKTNQETSDTVNSWFRQQFGTDPPAGMTVGFVDVACQIVRKGLGYICCFLPANCHDADGLCLTPMCRPDGTPIFRNTWFLYPQEKRLPPVLRDFVSYVKEELERQKLQG